MVKLVVGLGTIDDYELYADAGANEMFIGYVPYIWQKETEAGTPLNRREVFYSNVHIGSESELEILAQKIEKQSECGRRVPVTIAVNGLNYRPEHYEVIANIIRRCMQYGFRDFIVSDLGLLIYLEREGLCERIGLHISGEFGEMNLFQIRLLQKFNIKRIIYHRGTDLDDMRTMTKEFPKLEHEAFFMNERCHFTGAYCNSLHCDEMVPLCRLPYQLQTAEGKECKLQKEAEPDRKKTEKADGGRVYRQLRDVGITHLKIVGRGAATEDMVRDIRIAAGILHGTTVGEGDFYQYDK